jgi:hypothetical protein
VLGDVTVPAALRVGKGDDALRPLQHRPLDPAQQVRHAGVGIARERQQLDGHHTARVEPVLQEPAPLQQRDQHLHVLSLVFRVPGRGMSQCLWGLERGAI